MTDYAHVPVNNPQPDVQRFLDNVLGRAAGPPPLVEYIVDGVVMKPVVTELMGREWVYAGSDRPSQERHLDNFIAFWRAMGYDFVRLECGLPFHVLNVTAQDPAPGSDRDRSWMDQHHGTIMSWDDFTEYDWPNLADADFFPLEYVNSHLPEGMGLLSCHAGGIFEHVSAIMSIEGLCLALCEQPDLVRAVADKVGALLLAYHRQLLDLDGLVTIFQGDDMGFRTATLVGPDAMREYFLPWHTRFAEQAHAHHRPYFLHSCGNLELIMDTLVDDVGIDAKHSYEDAIVPVQEFQLRYGGGSGRPRPIGVLGGLDINILSGGTPEEVRNQTRLLCETCGPRGRYAIGSGNSVPSYVPVQNYLAMIDEALAFQARGR